VLLLDEPTRGVDVGTKAEILAILKRLARGQHIAVLAVSWTSRRSCSWRIACS
jgi:ABC-type sugar transport system ATPase subunit